MLAPARTAIWSIRVGAARHPLCLGGNLPNTKTPIQVAHQDAAAARLRVKPCTHISSGGTPEPIDRDSRLLVESGIASCRGSGRSAIARSCQLYAVMLIGRVQEIDLTVRSYSLTVDTRLRDEEARTHQGAPALEQDSAHDMLGVLRCGLRQTAL